MNVIFLSRLYKPHVGGVENQVEKLSIGLLKRGHKVTVITEKYDNKLKDFEKLQGVEVIRITYPKIKILGLFMIWLSLLKNIKLLKSADIIHVHDVFVWYLPFRFLFLNKPTYTTFHGWEGIYPVPKRNIVIRQIGALLSKDYLCVGKFIEKYYKIKAKNIIFPITEVPRRPKTRKKSNTILYVGRLDKDTGLPKILKALKKVRNKEIIFCGDGPMADECRKIGEVTGFTSPPKPYYEKSFICLSAGYASILEAFAHKCLVITTYDSPLKKDYLRMTPFSKYIEIPGSPAKLAERINFYTSKPDKAKEKIEEAYKWVQKQKSNNIIDQYLELWNI